MIWHEFDLSIHKPIRLLRRTDRTRILVCTIRRFQTSWIMHNLHNVDDSHLAVLDSTAQDAMIIEPDVDTPARRVFIIDEIVHTLPCLYLECDGLKLNHSNQSTYLEM